MTDKKSLADAITRAAAALGAAQNGYEWTIKLVELENAILEYHEHDIQA